MIAVDFNGADGGRRGVDTAAVGTGGTDVVVSAQIRYPVDVIMTEDPCKKTVIAQIEGDIVKLVNKGVFVKRMCVAEHDK